MVLQRGAGCRHTSPKGPPKEATCCFQIGRSVNVFFDAMWDSVQNTDDTESICKKILLLVMENNTLGSEIEGKIKQTGMAGWEKHPGGGAIVSQRGV